jgi:hypothetical protein
MVKKDSVTKARNLPHAPRVDHANSNRNWKGIQMGRGLLLWLIGIPLPIILIIWLFGGLS